MIFVMETTYNEKTKYIRKITIRNSLLAIAGYCMVLSVGIITQYIGFITISYTVFVISVSYILATNLIFLMIILKKKNLDNRLSVRFGYAQLINWLVTFFLITMVFEQERVVVLIFSFSALIYLVSYGTFRISLLMLTAVNAIYMGAAFVSIYILNQPGSLSREIFHVLCSIPAGIFISYMASLFRTQRERIHKARKEAETARDMLKIEMRKVEENSRTLVRLNEQLVDSILQVKTMSGFIPICANCKKIRDDKGYWDQIESYLHDHADLEFSSSLCPECAKELYPDIAV